MLRTRRIELKYLQPAIRRDIELQTSRLSIALSDSTHAQPSAGQPPYRLTVGLTLRAVGCQLLFFGGTSPRQHLFGISADFIPLSRFIHPPEGGSGESPL